jgi:hypothetical protein
MVCSERIPCGWTAVLGTAVLNMSTSAKLAEKMGLANLIDRGAIVSGYIIIMQIGQES